MLCRVTRRRHPVACRRCGSRHLTLTEVHMPQIMQYEQRPDGLILFRGRSTLLGAESYVRATCNRCGWMWRIRNVTDQGLGGKPTPSGVGWIAQPPVRAGC